MDCPLGLTRRIDLRDLQALPWVEGLGSLERMLDCPVRVVLEHNQRRKEVGQELVLTTEPIDHARTRWRPGKRHTDLDYLAHNPRECHQWRAGLAGVVGGPGSGSAPSLWRLSPAGERVEVSFDMKRGSMLRKGWVVVACAAAVSLLVSATAQSAQGPRTLRFLEVSWSESKSTLVDHNQNNRPDVGDVLISGSDLYSWSGGKRGGHIGVVRVVCMFVAPNAAHCRGTFSLPGGTFEALGYVYFGTTRRLPIVGGTGIYLGARGTFTSTTVGGPRSAKSADTVRLLP